MKMRNQGDFQEQETVFLPNVEDETVARLGVALKKVECVTVLRQHPAQFLETGASGADGAIVLQLQIRVTERM